MKVFSNFGVETTLVDMTDLAALEAGVKKNTKVDCWFTLRQIVGKFYREVLKSVTVSLCVHTRTGLIPRLTLE